MGGLCYRRRMNARNVNVYVIAAALLVGCADDIAARDYTAEACPAPIADPSVEPIDARDVCDRGRGYVPRFVSIAACMAEARVRPGTMGWGLRGTSPIFARCWPAVSVYTLDDVRNAPGLVMY